MSEPHYPAEAHAAARPDNVEEHHPHVNYMLVFGFLIAFTIISVLADAIGGWMGVERGTRLKLFIGLIVLIVASFKAMAVMMYFMHLKFERAWKYALLAPTIILALALIVSLMPDMSGEYYRRVIPQTEAAAAARHGATGESHVHPQAAPKAEKSQKVKGSLK